MGWAVVEDRTITLAEFKTVEDACAYELSLTVVVAPVTPKVIMRINVETKNIRVVHQLGATFPFVVEILKSQKWIKVNAFVTQMDAFRCAIETSEQF